MNYFKTRDDVCNFCERNVSLNVSGNVKMYCCEQCKNRAGTLRAGVHNKKYMPKTIDDTDKAYIKDYVTWLSGEHK